MKEKTDKELGVEDGGIEEEKMETNVQNEIEEKPMIGPREEASGPNDMTTSFSFILDDFFNREHQVYSDEHEFGGFRWRLLVFPKGNKMGQQSKESVSLYLDCLGPTADYGDGTMQVGWSRYASFKLMLVPWLPDLEPLCMETSHQFIEHETDWGFRDFVSLRLLTDKSRGFLKDDAVKFDVKVTLQDDHYDSRKHTGYAGFKNQGATCYMNSLLQTVYTLGTFRLAVYEMPLPEELDSNKISYALQKVFYDLQKGQGVVKTKKLTKSFGWDTADAFTQHDVQELNRLLTTHLEDALKGANKRNYISELFEGRLSNFVECVHVDFKSTREEAFFDISLNVKGCRDIYESLDKYTEVEMLDGENKYRADGFEELQEARKGVKILKLPPVLQLHLMRFDFDYDRELMVKINDRFEFYQEIDLSKYVDNSEGKDVYLLHSVLVHSGDVHGGHYYAFIRPDPDKQSWYKFDDELVTEAKASEALEDSFGVGGQFGDAGDGLNNNLVSMTPRRDFARKYTNAYWLQYIRKDKAKTILKPVSDDEIPPDLEERARRENEEEEKRKKERAEQHLYTNVAVATKHDLQKHVGPDLVRWDDIKKLRVKKAMLFSELKDLLVQKELISDVDSVRLWKLAMRQNKTIRPETLLTDSDEKRQITGFDDDLDDPYPLRYYNTTDIHMRLLALETPADPLVTKKGTKIIIFFKLYRSEPTPSLEFSVHRIVDKSDCLADHVEYLSKQSGIPADSIIFFEEASESVIRPLTKSTPFRSLGVRNTGDIIVFQAKPESNRSLAYTPSIGTGKPLGGRPMPTAVEYYEYLLCRTRVEFRNRLDPVASGVTIELLLRDSYETIRRHLAAAIGDDVDPDRIRISDTLRDKPFGLHEDNVLEAMLKNVHFQTVFTPQDVNTLYYERTEFPIQEYEQKEELRIIWSPDGGATSQERPSSTVAGQTWMPSTGISILVPYESKYEDAIAALCERLNMPHMKDAVRLVVVETKSAMISTIINLKDVILRGNRRLVLFSSFSELRAEPILAEERPVDGERKQLVQVVHVPKNRNQRAYKQTCFGSPFLLAIPVGGQSVTVIKRRIRARMGVSEEEMNSWRLAEMSTSRFAFLEDDTKVWEPSPDLLLAIERKNGQALPYPSYAFPKDRPLIIRG